MLDKYTLIGKRFFEKSIEKHKVKVNISPNCSIIDFNAKINNIQVRIICNYNEFQILSLFNNNDTQKGNEGNLNILVKLYLAGLLTMLENNNFKININFSKELINLFDYKYNILIKKEIITVEKTDIEKNLITQAHIIKFVKSNSDIKLDILSVFKIIQTNIKDHIYLEFETFIDAIVSLVSKEMITIVYEKEGSSKYNIEDYNADIIKMFKYKDIFPNIVNVVKEAALFKDLGDTEFTKLIHDKCEISDKVLGVKIQYLI